MRGGMMHYSIEGLDAAGMWSVLGQTVAYDRAVRWVVTVRRLRPDAPLRVMERPSGILRRLHDDVVIATSE